MRLLRWRTSITRSSVCGSGAEVGRGKVALLALVAQLSGRSPASGFNWHHLQPPAHHAVRL